LIPLHTLVESLQTFLLGCISSGAGDDRNVSVLLGFTATGDLSCIAGTESCGARERKAGQAFEDRGFSRGLITHNNKL
jgi:hypothetical protein